MRIEVRSVFSLILAFSLSLLYAEAMLIYSSGHKRLPGLFDGDTKNIALDVKEAQLPFELIWNFTAGKLFALEQIELNRSHSGEIEFRIQGSPNEEMNQFKELKVIQGQHPARLVIPFEKCSIRFVRLLFEKPIQLNEIQCRGKILDDPSPIFQIPPKLRTTLFQYLPPERDPEEKALWSDLQDTRLTEFTELDVYLITSGIFRQEDRQEYHERLTAWLTQFRGRYPKENVSPLQLGRILLESLHGSQAWLEHYDKSASDFQSLLEMKQFNCVSSVLLYAWMGTQLGLTVKIAEGADHTFGSLQIGKNVYPVETTSPLGFDLHTALSLQNNFQNQYGFQPYANQTSVRWVKGVEGAAMIYYNSGVEDERSQRYTEAIHFYKAALIIDPQFPAAYQNLLSAQTQWISQQITKKKFLKVLRRFKEFYAFFPDSPVLQQYEILVLNNYALELMDKKEYSKALTIFQKGLKRFPQNIYFQVNQDLVIGLLVQGMPYIEVEKIFATLDPQTPWIKHLRTKLLPAWADEALSTKKFEDAIRFYREHLAERPTPDIRQNLLFAYDQWAKDLFHRNHFLEAVQIYHDIYLETQSPEFLNNRNIMITLIGSQLLKEERYQEAWDWYQSVVTKLSVNPEGWSKEIRYTFQEYLTALVVEERWEEIKIQLQRLSSWKVQESFRKTLYQQSISSITEDLVKHQQFTMAIALLTPIAEEMTIQKLLIYVYYHWAEFYGKQEDYEKACKIYRQGLQTFPKESTFLNNLHYYEQYLVK